MRKFLYATAVIVSMVQRLFSYSPIIDGAEANIRINVVDDQTTIVSNATISVTFYTAPEKVSVKRGTTNENGIFAAKGQCIGEILAWIRKDGYYNTKIAPCFQTFSDQDVRKTRKWSEKPVETTVVLKKKRKPLQMSFHEMECKSPPVINKILALDLETFQWCPPYGDGRHEDVYLFYEAWQSPTNWFLFSRKLTVTFPNCVDGFYRLRKDPFSDFCYAYQANTNAVFEKSFELDFSRERAKIHRNIRPPDDEYLVFRVRTVTNELGQVVRANYGRIGEKIGHITGLSMRAWFNSTENDVNLEDSRFVP